MRARFAADDWGLSPAINAGILRLAEENCLYSVSIMSTEPFFKHRLDELIAATADGLRISLHLNFTYGNPLCSPPEVPSLVDPKTHGFYSHRQLILRALSRRIEPADVEREFMAQLQRLRDENVPVTGVDGHHHIHLLPGVAGPMHDALLRVGLLRVRMMADPLHRASYLQSQLYKKFIAPRNSALEFEDCKYLLPRDLESKTRFHTKLAQVGAAPLLVHPALYNDFESSGMLDKLRDERVSELKRILKYLND